MDGYWSHISAFRSIPALEPNPKVSIHHIELWDAIRGGLSTGRTFHFARCCSCLYDSRKKESNKKELNHTETESMAKFLGKRGFDSFEEFSTAVFKAEKNMKKPLDTISFNRSHMNTQNLLVMEEMRDKIAELEEQITSITDDHEKRIKVLELKNLELRNMLSKEISAQRPLVVASKKTLAFKE